MINADTFIETAGDTIAIPGDMPEWATPELIVEAFTSLPMGDLVTQAPNNTLILVETPYGAVYLAPGAPDWVNDNSIAQAKALFESGGIVPPPPPPPPPVEPSATGVLASIAETARAVGTRAGSIIGSAAGAVGDVASRVVGAVQSVIDTLVPTIQELAIGLTSRFADLASNIASKTIEFGTYSATLAVDAANAMGGVLDEAWTWIIQALIRFLNVLMAPLKNLIGDLTSNLLEPAL